MRTPGDAEVRGKGEAETLHAIRRLYQRYGSLGDTSARSLLAGWVADIQAIPPRAEFIDRSSNRVTRWKVQLPDGRPVVAVYDSARKRIATAYRPTVSSSS